MSVGRGLERQKRTDGHGPPGWEWCVDRCAWFHGRDLHIWDLRALAVAQLVE
jgi:hypothetical protein